MDSVGADLRAAHRERLVKRNRAPAGITAASEMPPYQPPAKADSVGADLRAAHRERLAKRNRAPTEKTAASEMPPYQPPAKADSVGADLRAAHRERHIKAEQSSHRDNGRLGDAVLPTTAKTLALQSRLASSGRLIDVGPIFSIFD